MEPIQDIKNLILSLEAPEADKQALIDQLDKEGASDSLFGKIKSLIEQSGQQVQTELEALAAEQKKIQEEYGKKIDDEYAQFQLDMKPLEEEVNQVAKEAEQELDELDMEDARQKIAGA